MTARTILGAACVGLLLAAGPTFAAERAGEVLAASGTAFREAAGQRAPLKTGDAVSVGDVVDVPDGARLKLRMIDGSVLSAASGTKLTIESYAGTPKRDASIALASGLLRAVVASVDQPSRFEVHSATGVAAVRSTDWFVQVRPDFTQVGVLEGAVALRSVSTGRAVEVGAGEGARIDAGPGAANALGAVRSVGRDPTTPRLWSKPEFDELIGRTALN